MGTCTRTEAGATTVAELTALGIAAVLVPLPRAPGDHQAKNARSLADADAALIVSDDVCTGASLAGALDNLLTNGRAERVGAAARRLGRRQPRAFKSRRIHHQGIANVGRAYFSSDSIAAEVLP